MRFYNATILLFLFLCLFCPLVCAAEQNETNEPQTLPALYAKGITHYKRGEYKQAAAAFRELVALSPRYQYYYDIGECEYLRKRYDLAIEAFEIFQKNAGNHIDTESREFIDKVLEESRSSVGYLDIKENTPLEVWVDDEHRGETPLISPLILMVGNHRVAFKQNGQIVAQNDIDIHQGKAFQIDEVNTGQPAPTENTTNRFDPNQKNVPPSETEFSTTTPAPYDSLPQKNVPIVGVGITIITSGGLALTAAGITGVMALHKSNQLEENCPDPKACDSSNQSLQQSGQSLKTATIVLATSGAVLATTGVILVLHGSKQKKTDPRAEVTAIPLIGQSALGVVLQGVF